MYSIPCKDCHSSYVGETRQLLEKRICKHKNDENKLNDHTALAVHANELHHNFNFEDTIILAREKNTKRRKIREVIEIRKKKNNLNFKRDSESLSNIYLPVISRCK